MSNWKFFAHPPYPVRQVSGCLIRLFFVRLTLSLAVRSRHGTSCVADDTLSNGIFWSCYCNWCGKRFDDNILLYSEMQLIWVLRGGKHTRHQRSRRNFYYMVLSFFYWSLEFGINVILVSQLLSCEFSNTSMITFDHLVWKRALTDDVELIWTDLCWWAKTWRAKRGSLHANNLGAKYLAICCCRWTDWIQSMVSINQSHNK